MARSPADAKPRPWPVAKLRRLALQSQGLLKEAPFGRGRGATLRALERIGYVQIDTISVVSRAHHHVLHSRVPNYRPAHLNALLGQGAVFEYWFHAAAYLPMRDYRYARPRMGRMREGTEAWIRCRDRALMSEVLARVRAEGPLRARDFESARGETGNWWQWKPAKRALEQLFMQGDLMVTSREGIQKTYDLTERVLPSGTDTRMPTHREMAEYLLRTHLTAHGFIAPTCVTHGRRGAPIRAALTAALEEGVEERRLVTLRQPCGTIAYADPERLEARGARAGRRALLLSPFDNAVIHRDRIRSLFDYEYRIECYLKEKDRRYGYFCLPVLYRDALIGRADCKAHRGEGRFEVKHLHLGRSATDDPGLLSSLAAAFRRFAAFNGCDDFSVTRVSGGPPDTGRVLERAFAA